MKRAYTRREIYEMGFPQKEYDFPEKEEGDTFIGTLIMKKWTDRNGLLCYFDCDNGEKYKIYIWPRNDYKPRDSELDISYVELGTKLKVDYIMSKKGRTNWVNAEIVE